MLLSQTSQGWEKLKVFENGIRLSMYNYRGGKVIAIVKDFLDSL